MTSGDDALLGRDRRHLTSRCGANQIGSPGDGLELYRSMAEQRLV